MEAITADPVPFATFSAGKGIDVIPMYQSKHFYPLQLGEKLAGMEVSMLDLEEKCYLTIMSQNKSEKDATGLFCQCPLPCAKKSSM